jgi:capsular polysaccharide biosynthesis protein
MNDAYGTRSLREIVRILFQHWFMLACVIALGGGATYYLCEFVATRKYRSQVSLIYKRPQNKNPLSSDAGERPLEVFVKAQQQILMSDLVLARAKVIAEDAGLRRAWYALRDRWAKALEASGGAVATVQEEIRGFLHGQGDAPSPVARKVQDLLSRQQEELLRFRKSVKLETPGGEQVGMTETFMVTVDRPGRREEREPHLNAHFAADLVADMYIVRYQELQQALNDPALRVMQDVVDKFNGEVERRRLAYDKFIQENVADITGLEQLLKSGTEQGRQLILTEVRKNDASLHLALARDQAVYDAISKTLPPKAMEAGFVSALGDDQVAGLVDSISSEFLNEDVAYVELTKSLVALEARKARIAPQYMEESRDLRYLNESITQVRRRMLGAILGYARGLGARILARQQQVARNEELVRRNEEEQNKIHAKLARYVRLKNDFEVAQKQLDKLEEERIAALTNRSRAREAVMISKLDQASIPDVGRPVVPLTGIYTAVAVAVCVLLGVALAFLADHFDHTLRSAVEAERHLGVPVLGSVKRRGRRLVVPM